MPSFQKLEANPRATRSSKSRYSATSQTTSGGNIRRVFCSGSVGHMVVGYLYYRNMRALLCCACSTGWMRACAYGGCAAEMWGSGGFMVEVGGIYTCIYINVVYQPNGKQHGCLYDVLLTPISVLFYALVTRHLIQSLISTLNDRVVIIVN